MLKRLILTLSLVLSTSLFSPESAKAGDSYIYQDLQTSYSGSSKCISERNISASSYPIKSSSITTSAYCTLFFYQTSGYPKTVITNGLPTVIYGQWNKIWEGRIQATRQSNLDLNYIIKTPPATTLLSPTEYRYRFALCEDPNAQTSRQLTSPSSQSCRTYQVTSVGATISRTPQQTSNPAPQQTTNPAPQQTTNPAPQQTTNPAPQQTSNPAPQQTTNPTPQQTTNPNPLGLPIETPYTPDYSVYINENRRIISEVYNSLVEEIKQTRQPTCKKYNLWTNLQNIEPYAQFLPGGETCLDYESIKQFDFSLVNIIISGATDNQLILSTSSLDPRFGDVKIDVFFTKKGTNKSKIIAKPKLKIESRRTHHCYFDRKGTFLDTPYNDWDCRMDATYPGHYAVIDLPKSVGRFASVGGDIPTKINGKLEIVLTNKKAVGKKKLVYKWNQKIGWFTGGTYG